MSNLVNHAKAEFKALGYIPLDEEQEDGPNKWIQENVMQLIEVFSKQGHSGSSAPFCINYFKKLAAFDPLSPLKFDDSEWNNAIDKNVFQNNRLSSVFKDGKDGTPYYINAIVWKNEKGLTYTGHALDSKGNSIGSSQIIKMPFKPKTFYIDVIEEEVKKDDWVFHIKDDAQLDEVFKHYDRKDY